MKATKLKTVCFQAIVTVKIETAYFSANGNSGSNIASINVYNYTATADVPCKEKSLGNNEAMHWLQNNWKSFSPTTMEVHLTGVDGKKVTVLGDIRHMCITKVTDEKGKELPCKEPEYKSRGGNNKRVYTPSSKSSKTAPARPKYEKAEVSVKAKPEKPKSAMEKFLDKAERANTDRVSDAVKKALR